MLRVRRGFIGVAFAFALALPAIAATPSEFYLSMLRKGVVAYEAGRFESAAGSLKIAAFGLVDSIEHYQTAQIHLALTHDRLANAELARESARRVVVAERIEPRYGSLGLSAATRASFDALARRLLAAADVTILGQSAPGQATPQRPAPPPPQPTTTTTTATTTNNNANSNNKPVPPRTPVKADPVVTKPAPVKTDPVPPKTDPVVTKPAPVVAKPQPAPVKADPPAAKPQPQPARPSVNVTATFAAAEQALSQARLTDARALYRQLLDSASLQRADFLRLAEGFYRARDFANALRAFERAGALRRGEEPYRYYIAVALYETGQYARAKDELTAALPFIEQTPDVTRYRLKIEGAVN